MPVESVESSFPPMNMIRENPDLRWSFIRKIYSITIFQLLLIIVVVCVVLFVSPVADFFNSKQGTVLYEFLVFVVSLLVLRLPQMYLHTHPLRYFLLLFINVSSALPFGLTCVFAGDSVSIGNSIGKVIVT
ncbi:hypothetical protein TSUD_05000 [Trifolium subterraneum]|uniref:BI1-like protein n=1 Tax=Trifolium subterraneum TaxID=3900 RepID=A0A2Z6N4R4_TRISU|nr:hypothetical protein TSUD_05000 [Trifolium subterraneum]